MKKQNPLFTFSLLSIFIYEVLERFSYYGLKSILTLYLITPIFDGGMGINRIKSIIITGNYVIGVFICGLLMGFVTDKIGKSNSLLLGSFLITTGHFLIHIKNIKIIYIALILLSIASGLIKTSVINILSYECDKIKKEQNIDIRDKAFGIFYTSINIGSLAGISVLSFISIYSSYKKAFFISFLIMFFALFLILITKPGKFEINNNNNIIKDLKKEEKTLTNNRLITIILICLASIYYYIIGLLDTSLIVQYIEKYCINKLFFIKIPPSLYQSLNPIIVILFALPVSVVIEKLIKNKKIENELYILSFSIFLMIISCIPLLLFRPCIRICGYLHPILLIIHYFIYTIAEIIQMRFLTSKLISISPKKYVGLIIGSCYSCNAFGVFISKYISIYCIKNDFNKGIFFVIFVGILIFLIITILSKKLNYLFNQK